MIAKLCAYGADRDEAIERLRGALDGFYIAGLRHNIAFLAAIVEKRRFVDGALSTDFIAQEFPEGFAPPAEVTEADRVIVIAAAIAEHRLADSEGAPATTSRCVLIDGARHNVTLRPEPGGYRRRARRRNLPRGERLAAGRQAAAPAHRGARRDGADRPPTRPRLRLTHAGVTRRAQVLSPRAAELLQMMPPKVAADTSRRVLSPMPGLLSAVVVEEGQEVKAGEALAIVEAMKMENVLRAERDGTIAKLCAKAGDLLAVDQVILEFA
jgi:propionyl-CoA carboxylase alpha chain